MRFNFFCESFLFCFCEFAKVFDKRKYDMLGWYSLQIVSLLLHCLLLQTNLKKEKEKSRFIHKSCWRWSLSEKWLALQWGMCDRHTPADEREREKRKSEMGRWNTILIEWMDLFWHNCWHYFAIWEMPRGDDDNDEAHRLANRRGKWEVYKYWSNMSGMRGF